MTTKPKARKFRIRRTGGPSEGAPSGAPAMPAAQAPRPAAPRPAAPTGNTARMPVTPETLVQSPANTARPANAETPAAHSAPHAPQPQPRPEAAQPEATRPAARQPETASGGPAPEAMIGDITSASEMRVETDIDAIRKEGLTGRQLRMARRVAQKHGLAPISDFDAVRQLRLRGIDPFQRANMLELVAAAEGGGSGGNTGAGGFPVDTGGKPPDMGRVQLPQTVQMKKAGLPSTDTMSPAERRAAEIMQIQRDIARRRRRKLALLFARLSAFVFMPTLLAGWYYFVMATPMYATHTEFLIIQADGGGGGGLRGLLPSNYATSQDSIAVQSYLQSKDAMLRLDKEHGYREHFSDPSIDPIQRLAPDASNEAMHKLYKKNVKIGYDPTEGVIRMEVVAANPQVALDFSNLLVEFAEERVDDLSRQKREDGMLLARESLEEAKGERRDAQAALVKLQETEGVDPAEQLGVLRSQIATYEGELLEKQLQLAALLDNPRPNQAKVEGAQGDVRRIGALLDTLNGRMVEATNGQDSLAARAARIQIAQADLAAADASLQIRLDAFKQAQVEAGKQVRYLTIPVKPVAAQEPSYPRAFENTVLAFLIFAGIYLMISLTASILREQVSS